MTNYINFVSMSSLERHVFQSTGECSDKFHMGEHEFNKMVDEMVDSQHKQAMQQEQELVGEDV